MLPYTGSLQNMLHEERVERKVWAIQTLKGLGTAAVPSLIQAFHDKERAVKVYAIGALSDIGGLPAVPSLIEALESESEDWSNGTTISPSPWVISASKSRSRRERPSVRVPGNVAQRIVPTV